MFKILMFFLVLGSIFYLLNKLWFKLGLPHEVNKENKKEMLFLWVFSLVFLFLVSLNFIGFILYIK